MMRGMRAMTGAILAAAAFLAAAQPAASQKKEYLSELEADKIRDAETATLRVKLFLSFAADRIKKIQYELERPARDRQWEERINSLFNAYAGCVDDAADTLEAAIDKLEDIRPAIKEMDSRTKEFQEYLDKLAAGHPDLAKFKDSLDDAIESTQDAKKTSEKAAKATPAAPVRRKPS
jgi:chromosome segregation ATPase